MKKIIAIITLIMCCFSLFACKGAQGENGDKGDPGESGGTTYEGTEGLDFYPLPDGTYGVKAGKAMYLEEIVIPSEYNGKKVTQILERAFEDCYSLKSVMIPASIETIGYRAFCDCTSLASIEIPSNVKTIYLFSFYGCSKLSNIEFKGTIEQWNSIDFVQERVTPGSYTSGYWYDGPATEVVCSDGTVPPLKQHNA